MLGPRPFLHWLCRRHNYLGYRHGTSPSSDTPKASSPDEQEDRACLDFYAGGLNNGSLYYALLADR